MLQLQGQAMLTVKRRCALSLWKKIEAIIEGKISLTLNKSKSCKALDMRLCENMKGDQRLFFLTRQVRPIFSFLYCLLNGIIVRHHTTYFLSACQQLDALSPFNPLSEMRHNGFVVCVLRPLLLANLLSLGSPSSHTDITYLLDRTGLSQRSFQAYTSLVPPMVNQELDDCNINLKHQHLFEHPALSL